MLAELSGGKESSAQGALMADADSATYLASVFWVQLKGAGFRV